MSDPAAAGLPGKQRVSVGNERVSNPIFATSASRWSESDIDCKPRGARASEREASESTLSEFGV
jgi:hypothetical protein